VNENGVMKKILLLIIAVLFWVASAAHAWPHKGSKRPPSPAFTAVVTHVTDGDTIWVSKGNGEQAIDVRLQGIDAPEICQDYGRTAQAALAARVLRHTVSVTGRARDKYGRMIAKVSSNGEDLGAWLVVNGHAWSNHYRQSLGTYGQQETAARQAGRGLWAGFNPIEPKLFRESTKCHK